MKKSNPATNRSSDRTASRCFWLAGWSNENEDMDWRTPGGYRWNNAKRPPAALAPTTLRAPHAPKYRTPEVNVGGGVGNGTNGMAPEAGRARRRSPVGVDYPRDRGQRAHQ